MSPSLVETLETLKLALELFVLSFPFIPSLECLFSPFLSFPWYCLWFACVVCGVFLVVGGSLGCLVRFSFCLKKTLIKTESSLQTMHMYTCMI